MAARFLTLMNPHRRRRSKRLYGAALAAHQRRVGGSRRTHRRVRRNPAARRARPARRSSHHSAAMRAKISRAVRASFRRRRSGGGNVAIARRRPSRRRSRTFAVARRRSVVFHAPARRRSSRRLSRSSFGGGNLVGSFRSALSKPLLMKAGGAVAASLGVGMLLQRFSSSLPMATNKWGKVIYSVGIPVAAAYFVRRKSPHLAEGLVIGGLVMGINALISQARAASGGTVGSYPAIQDMGVAGELGYSFYPSQAGQVGAPSASAFTSSAW